MNRRNLLAMLALLPAVSRSQSLGDVLNAVKDPLIGMLTNKLGITDNQAQGGMGSLLTLAKERMKPNDFGKVTTLIPTATKYMDTAKQLGAVVGPLKNATGLNRAFSKLGMQADTAKQFVPTVTNYVGQIGGEPLKKMLTGVLK